MGEWKRRSFLKNIIFYSWELIDCFNMRFKGVWLLLVIFLLSTISVYGDVNISQTMFLAHYSLETLNSNVVVDNTGNYDGITDTTLPIVDDGAVGEGYNFIGLNSYFVVDGGYSNNFSTLCYIIKNLTNLDGVMYLGNDLKTPMTDNGNWQLDGGESGNNLNSRLWSDGVVNYGFDTTNDYSDGVWRQVCHVSDGINFSTYVNGVWKYNDGATAIMGGTLNQNFTVGSGFYWAFHDFDGMLDEIALFNLPLSPKLIKEYYNEGDFMAWGDFTAPPITYDLNTLLLNQTKSVIPFIGIDEDTLFYVGTNFTRNDDIMVGGVCNFTALNISGHWSKDSKSNYSMNLSTDVVSILVTESNKSVVTDVVGLRVCYEQVGVDVQILKDGGLYRTIPSSSIPKCTVGFHNELNSTLSFINDSNINISVSCSSCNGGNRRIKIISDDIDGLLHFERDFSSHTEPLTYNSTNKIYEFTEHLYHYTLSGIDKANITTRCNDSRDGKLFNITDINLSISVVSINDVPFINRMNVESNLTTVISIEVTGDLVSLLDFNLSYPNGSFVKHVDVETMSLSNEELNVDGFYNISILAIDNDGIKSEYNASFQINDTTAPVINWINPLSNNASEFVINTNVTLNFTIFDLNLYAYNISIYYPDGTLFKNTTKIGNTGHGLINISDVLSFDTLGYWRIDVEAGDDHHLSGQQLLDNLQISKTKDNLKFDNKINIYAEGSIYSEVYKNKYSYSYEFVYFKQLIKKYVVSSDSYLEHIKNSVYGPAHFVDYNNGLWIDFGGVNDTPIIKRINNTAFLVTFNNLPDVVKFHSVGPLNNIFESKRFKVIVLPVMESNVSMDCMTNVAPAFNDRMDWLCILNNTIPNRFKCNSYVEIESRVIQVNPNRENIELFGVSETFNERNGLVNAYFTTENLRISANHTYNFIIKCSSNGTTTSYNLSVKPDYVAPKVVIDRMLWSMDNAGYIVGGIIVFLFLILIILTWWNLIK